jgi:thiamine-phosphate pyrophosphorylase
MYLGGLCFITDRRICRLSHEEMVLRVLREGVKWVQYRDKDSSRRELYREARKLSSILRDFDAVFVVNDYPDIALAVEADGVHLGQDDLPAGEARKILGRDKLVGVSTHNVEQAIDAEQDGADYIGFGPIFHTMTKDAGSPRGIDLLREVKRRVHIPVVAIGGITLDNVRSVLDTKADAVAVASAVLIGDVEENTRRFMDIVRSYSSE